MAATHIGNCQVCEHDQKLRGDKLVLHGYERPGHGFIVGDCPGVGELPYELSCELIRKYREGLRAGLPAARNRLAQLQARTVIEFTRWKRERAGWGRSEMVEHEYVVGVTAPELLESECRSLESDVALGIRQVEGAIARCGERIRAWKLRPLRAVVEKAPPPGPIWKAGDRVRHRRDQPERVGEVLGTWKSRMRGTGCRYFVSVQWVDGTKQRVVEGLLQEASHGR
jgi:hypothetical protein